MTSVVVNAQKQPPPEKPEAGTLRTKVILSFWAVIIFLGLPTWLQTTSIYRASLPLEDMLEWSEGVNTRHIDSYATNIWLSASEASCSDIKQILAETQSQLDTHDDFRSSRLRLRFVQTLDVESSTGKKSSKKSKNNDCDAEIVQPGDIQPGLKIQLKPTQKGFDFAFQQSSDIAQVEFPVTKIAESSKALSFAIHNVFQNERISMARVLATKQLQHGAVANYLQTQPPEVMTLADSRHDRAVKASPEYHLTFSLFTAGGTPSNWDVQEALTRHIEPLKKALSSAAKIRITTQIQLYSSFSPSVQPQRREGQNGYVLQQNHLTAFVNTAEWPISPSIGAGPTLNFILYIPHKDHVPLTIGENQGTSWLIPQWGTISILNPKLVPNRVSGVPSVPANLDAKTLQSSFEGFASQLLSLLGVPSASASGTRLPLSFRIQSYKRELAFDLYWKAAASLGSLARLADHLNNIPIPKHVAQLVEDTRGNLTVAASAFRDGNWDRALVHAQMAYTDSEMAFFDKSMVGQVYFPDEHKVAVYLPLLGPIGVPLIVSLIKEVKQFMAVVKARKA